MNPVAKRAALLTLISALAALPRSALGQDDAACVKYQEPLAYNACLASHGPKANSIGEGPGQTQPPAPRLIHTPDHQRDLRPGPNGPPQRAVTVASTWSFVSSESRWVVAGSNGRDA